MVCSAEGDPQMTPMDEIKQDHQTYAIIGAAMEVHGVLGGGFLEGVYHEALAMEFTHRSIPFRREASLKITYKNQVLSDGYRADFVCCDTIIVELKALARLSTTEEAQVINYLKASEMEKALLFNFGASRLEYRRLILAQPHLRPSAAICG
jgi:GxxExxY protein